MPPAVRTPDSCKLLAWVVNFDLYRWKQLERQRLQLLGMAFRLGGPSPNIGLNTFTGPWTASDRLNLERAWNIKEYGKLMFRVTGFNMFNHPNYYV